MTVPKLCGADVEVGNFLLGSDSLHGTGSAASRALLREVPGACRESRSTGFCNCPACRGSSTRDFAYDPQDWGRRFLPANGGCVYIDLDHLELCLPEVQSAHDHLAAWHAMLRIARTALDAANAKLTGGKRIQVLVNNSDGQGHSYGSHLNFLVSRRTWDHIFGRKPHLLLYLAAYQASSIVLTGQGKVGAENGTPTVDYQISQRADFFETLTGEQTTHHRPIVNSRDESLCGRLFSLSGTRSRAEQYARLHVIFYDSNLCHTAHVLKVGVMQIILALIESGRINPEMLLDDPLDAVQRWSHDPSLRCRMPLISGKQVTAVELQEMFFDEAQRFVARGGCTGIVPRAGEIIGLWHDTLQKLKVGDLDPLAGRLDWVLKRRIMEQALRQHPELTWDSPPLKHLDHLYSSLDLAEGLYWAYERAGVTERLVSDGAIERFVHDAPEDTRAWTRSRLLRLAGTEAVDLVDWDSIRFRMRGQSYWPTYRSADLADPLAFTRAQTESLLQAGETLDAVLDRLEEVAAGERPPQPLLPPPRLAGAQVSILYDDRPNS
jgi:proteasome accessory factor A